MASLETRGTPEPLQGLAPSSAGQGRRRLLESSSAVLRPARALLAERELASANTLHDPSSWSRDPRSLNYVRPSTQRCMAGLGSLVYFNPSTGELGAGPFRCRSRTCPVCRGPWHHRLQERIREGLELGAASGARYVFLVLTFARNTRAGCALRERWRERGEELELYSSPESAHESKGRNLARLRKRLERAGLVGPCGFVWTLEEHADPRYPHLNLILDAPALAAMLEEHGGSDESEELRANAEELVKRILAPLVIGSGFGPRFSVQLPRRGSDELARYLVKRVSGEIAKSSQAPIGRPRGGRDYGSSRGFIPSERLLAARVRARAEGRREPLSDDELAPSEWTGGLSELEPRAFDGTADCELDDRPRERALRKRGDFELERLREAHEWRQRTRRAELELESLRDLLSESSEPRSWRAVVRSLAVARAGFVSPSKLLDFFRLELAPWLGLTPRARAVAFLSALSSREQSSEASVTEGRADCVGGLAPCSVRMPFRSELDSPPASRPPEGGGGGMLGAVSAPLARGAPLEGRGAEPPLVPHKNKWPQLLAEVRSLSLPFEPCTGPPVLLSGACGGLLGGWD
jgi:hypothetical protein